MTRRVKGIPSNRKRGNRKSDIINRGIIAQNKLHIYKTVYLQKWLWWFASNPGMVVPFVYDIRNCPMQVCIVSICMV